MKRLLPFITVLAILLISCKQDRLDVDVSAITVPQVKILHYEKDFFAIDTGRIAVSLASLRKRYGDFSDGFINNIICRQALDSFNRDLAIRDFLLDKDMRDVNEECQKLFPVEHFTQMENEITDAYKHFRYYFPKRKLPNAVYTDMAGFSNNILNISGSYGISLEFYLGQENIFYDALQDLWPAYRRRVSTKEYMTSNFIKAWMMNEFPYTPEPNTLINKMVYEGKILYLEKALLRNTPDSIIIGCSQKKLDWSEANEAKMWATLIEQKKLYSGNEEDLNHYTEDGAYTPGFPRESPGKAGNWIGLRIVETFMDKNPTVTLEQLMQIKDGQAILIRSKYKPKF
jgi:hypothetical protein